MNVTWPQRLNLWGMRASVWRYHFSRQQRGCWLLLHLHFSSYSHRCGRRGELEILWHAAGNRTESAQSRSVLVSPLCQSFLFAHTLAASQQLSRSVPLFSSDFNLSANFCTAASSGTGRCTCPHLISCADRGTSLATFWSQAGIWAPRPRLLAVFFCEMTLSCCLASSSDLDHFTSV